MGAGALPASPAASIGVVTALSSEARCLGPLSRRPDGPPRLRDGTLVRVAGIGPALAASAAEMLARAGATALLSFGVAGGLDPTLGCAAVLLASEVGEEGGAALATSAVWREALSRRLGARATQGALLSSAVLVVSRAEKARLFARTRALAVDMESAAIAAVARRHGLPFMALRVIVDTAHDALPAELLPLLAPGRTWSALLTRPRLWPQLTRLAGRYRRARRALRQCARAGIAP